MVDLTNDCLYEIFNNYLKKYPRQLFTCLLVNRQWCSIIVPILWSKSTKHCNDKRLMKIYLLSLNEKEKAPLNQLNIPFPNDSKPLINYTSYTTYVNNSDLKKGITNYLHRDKYESNYDKNDEIYEIFNEDKVAKVVEYSLITMLARTSKKIKYFSFNEITSNRLVKILENFLYKSTTLTTLIFNHIEFSFQAIKALANILRKNGSLDSLTLHYCTLRCSEYCVWIRYRHDCEEEGCDEECEESGDEISDLYYNDHRCVELKTLTDALFENTSLSTLSLRDNIFCDDIAEEEFEKDLYRNKTLASFNLAADVISFKSAKVFAEFLYNNISLTSLNLYNIRLFDFEGFKAMAETISRNNVLTSLALVNCGIGLEGVKAIAEVLCKNILTSLDLRGDNIGFEEAKILTEALRENTTLTSLSLSLSENGENTTLTSSNHSLRENSTLTSLNLSLRDNTTLTSLSLCNNQLGTEGVKVLAEILSVNYTLTSLTLGGEIKIDGIKALSETLYTNTTLTSLSLCGNFLNQVFEAVKILTDALCKNTTLTDLTLYNNKLTVKEGELLADFLCQNTALTSLNLKDNQLGYLGP
ncbi:Protein NLRC3 [Gigaspora margarita]|uniref:Protein NLRC3 n=2 Tax=Gigaspora margarita TaxID=4874 RepID=A0A8H3ZWS7_GIGMA|nr:Protein NLRC3 [Gigaspora margarita]